MSKRLNLFHRFYKKKFSGGDKSHSQISQSMQQTINKAVNFIKVMQFHSGFPEIASPERGGDIEVTIHQDKKKPGQFHINFAFVTLPSRTTLLRKEKIINYAELKRLANEYDKHKDQIDEELRHRDSFAKNNFAP